MDFVKKEEKNVENGLENQILDKIQIKNYIDQEAYILKEMDSV